MDKPAKGEVARSADELAEAARERLERYIAKFDDPSTPYPSQPRRQFVNKFGDYDHLARRKEWSTAPDAENGQRGWNMSAPGFDPQITSGGQRGRSAQQPIRAIPCLSRRMPGRGKTRVLVDRVARLLLEDVRPDSILCVTFTKAAAGEMQERLFRKLGDWSVMSDTEYGKGAQ